MVATSTSTRINIPLPPPYGVSSTLRCFPRPKVRGFLNRTANRPLEIARAMILVARKSSNISGNNVTISKRTAGSRPLCPLDAVHRREHYQVAFHVDRTDDRIDERSLPGTTAVLGIHEDRVERRVRSQLAYGPKLPFRSFAIADDHTSALQIADVEFTIGKRWKGVATGADLRAAERVRGIAIVHGVEFHQDRFVGPARRFYTHLVLRPVPAAQEHLV